MKSEFLRIFKTYPEIAEIVVLTIILTLRIVSRDVKTSLLIMRFMSHMKNSQNHKK